MTIHRKNRHWSASLILASVLASAPAEAMVFTDNFDTNIIDSAWWTVATDGDSTITATNDRLELTQGTNGFAALTFNTSLVGDFSVSVDYSLLNWPTNNQERAVLNAYAEFNNQLLVERVSDVQYDPSVARTGEVYLSDFPGQGVLGTPSSDSNGTLRLERSGDTVLGSFWSGSEWTIIGVYQVPGENSLARAIGFGIFAGSSVTPGVKVAFDNFQLNAAPAPLPPTALLMLTGLTIFSRRPAGKLKGCLA